MLKFNSEYWALIIGGSGGFGLAAARKLARHGMNIVIVHRDRRQRLRQIEPIFDEIRSLGVQINTFNHIIAKARLRNPFHRLTRPEDVANAIFLMCIDEASWINGSLIRVDGGERIA